MKGKLNDIVSYMTLVAGFVTIVWFIQDSRNQNSKELKNQTEILLEIQKSNENQNEILLEIQKSSERMQKSLERINESSERQIKILQKIEAKYK